MAGGLTKRLLRRGVMVAALCPAGGSVRAGLVSSPECSPEFRTPRGSHGHHNLTGQTQLSFSVTLASLIVPSRQMALPSIILHPLPMCGFLPQHTQAIL